MMRWTIPTLVDTLYRNGLDVDTAGAVVAATYPLTQGDENWMALSTGRDRFDHVGPYALWEPLRGDYPADAPTHAGADARTIVAALRGNRTALEDVVDLTGPRDPVIDDVVARTVAYLIAGGTVDAQTVDTSTDALRVVQQQTETVDAQRAAVAQLRANLWN